VRRCLAGLRLTDRPTVTQIVELLGAQRPAGVRVLDRLALLIEAGTGRWRHGAVVERLLLLLFLWALLLRRIRRLAADGTRVGLGKLLGAVDGALGPNGALRGCCGRRNGPRRLGRRNGRLS
jgi:HAMP domain-containing protein